MSKTRFDFEKDVPAYQTAIRRVSPQRDWLSLSKTFKGAFEAAFEGAFEGAFEISDLRIDLSISGSITKRQGSTKPTNAMERCPADALRERLVGIRRRYDGANWERENLLHDYDDILEEEDGNLVSRISSCLCDSCQQSRNRASLNADSSSFDLNTIRGSRRLFAISILINHPFLICHLVRQNYDDSWFYCCDDPDDLKLQSKISDDDIATAVFRCKGLFFGCNVARYIRSSGEYDAPPKNEQEWLMEQMLAITEIMADSQEKSQRRLLENGWIGDLTFTTHSGMDFRRLNNGTASPWDKRLSLQSFGYLLLDIIFFLAWGADGVARLDLLREHHSDGWFRHISEGDIMSLYKKESLGLPVGRAFDLVRALIRPQGPFGLSYDKSYEYLRYQLASIWGSTAENHTSQDESVRGSTSSSNKSPSSDHQSNEEIAEHHFRWLSLYYEDQKFEHSHGPCWIRVATKTLTPPDKKSPTDTSLYIYIYPFDHMRPIKPIESNASLKSHSGLQFVPLYAFHHDELSESIAPRTAAYNFRVEHKDHSPQNEIHYIFTARTRKEAVLAQKALTGQNVQKDTVLAGFLVKLERRTGFLRQWTETKLEAREFGTLQIWPVMNEEELESTKRTGPTRLPKFKKLQFEIALFCHDKLFILDVRSQLQIKDSSELKLKILPYPERLHIDGKLFEKGSTKMAGRYPGLPLFEDASPKIWRDGEETRCMSFELEFKDVREKDNLKTWLVGHFDARIVDR